MVVLFTSSILLLTALGPRSMARESLYAFLVAQTISWPLTIFTVYWGKIESPVRLFPNATDSIFILAFVFHPAVFAAYYLHYPRQRGHILQTAFTLAVTGSIALIHVALQKYTDLVKYISFSGYTLWLIGIIAFLIQRRYIDWYFKQLAKEASNNPE